MTEFSFDPDSAERLAGLLAIARVRSELVRGFPIGYFNRASLLRRALTMARDGICDVEIILAALERELDDRPDPGTRGG